MPWAVWSAHHAAFMASAKWREVRAPIVARANGHCEKCSQPTKGFQVHHLTYERFGGDELPEDLAAWCAGCHSAHHKIRRKPRKVSPKPKPRFVKRMNRKARRKVLWKKCHHCGGTYSWKRHRQICEKYKLA